MNEYNVTAEPKNASSRWRFSSSFSCGPPARAGRHLCAAGNASGSVWDSVVTSYTFSKWPQVSGAVFCQKMSQHSLNACRPRGESSNGSMYTQYGSPSLMPRTSWPPQVNSSASSLALSGWPLRCSGVLVNRGGALGQADTGVPGGPGAVFSAFGGFGFARSSSTGCTSTTRCFVEGVCAAACSLFSSCVSWGGGGAGISGASCCMGICCEVFFFATAPPVRSKRPASSTLRNSSSCAVSLFPTICSFLSNFVSIIT
mmetsp:Transcript_13053/g.31907  ORF Transcript_13053/g.31907 Transcript_13053/m.31907 type:complete len:257 (+) Transcript_13053:909-1679(+)